MKDRLEMMVCQVLHTDLNRRREFTGSRTRISDTRSSGISAGRAGLRNLLLLDMNPGLFAAEQLRSTLPVFAVALLSLVLRSALFVVFRSIVAMINRGGDVLKRATACEYT